MGDRNARVPHPFPLRPTFLVVAELPEDLTAEEADRLATWVRTLAVAEATETDSKSFRAGDTDG